MIKLVSQYDNYTEKAWVATPSGWKCCCCCCCCCVITASTAIHMQWRYLERLQNQFITEIDRAKTNEIEASLLKQEIGTVLSRKSPWFYKLIIWWTIIFQMIIWTLFVWSYFLASLSHTFHPLGILIFISIILMFWWAVHAIYTFYHIRKKVDPQVKSFSYKELHLGRKLLYILLLWGAGVAEIILLVNIANWNWFI